MLRFGGPCTYNEARDYIAEMRDVIARADEWDHCPCCVPEPKEVDYVERCLNEAIANHEPVEQFCRFSTDGVRCGRVTVGVGTVTWLLEGMTVVFSHDGSLIEVVDGGLPASKIKGHV